jgi:hypothetical protein
MKTYKIPYGFKVTGCLTVEVSDSDNGIDAKAKLDDHLLQCKKDLARAVLENSQGSIKIKKL